MSHFKRLNIQTGIALTFSLVILLVIGGGIVTFINLSGLAGALPGFNTAEKFGPELYDALARTRLTLTYILFLEVLLLLPLGIGMMRAVTPRLKNNGERALLPNTPLSLPRRGTEPETTTILKEIGDLTNQMAEAARKANEVMAHSQTAIKKGIATSEATLEALKENKKLTYKITQLIENMNSGFQKQPESFH